MERKKVRLGIENLESVGGFLGNKRIALITNHTGLDSGFKSSIDIFHQNFNLVKLFAPEHGVRGDMQAGEVIESYTDERTNIPVISLYGQNRRPTAEMLSDVDVLAFDIQDVGSRFYTYCYTMTYCMESAAKFGKQMIVFDRPNPINGVTVEGNILDLEYKSFIGALPITQRYALTIGELAAFFNGETGLQCDLRAVPLSGWQRDMYFEDTGLPWVLPSPNIPTPETASAFTATCIFEGTNVSEGRGTTKPFQLIGAPYIKGLELEAALNNLALPGVAFRAAYFTPYFSKHKDELCGGVELLITDKKLFKPVETGLHMLYKIMELSGDKFDFTPEYREGGRKMIEYNTGSGMISARTELAVVLEKYKADSEIFEAIKAKYHIY